MEVKYKGEALSEEWNKDLTVGKTYHIFDFGLSSSYIIDDVSEKVNIGHFRLSEFEIIGGNE